MDVTPLVKKGAKIIQGYAGGSFRISGQVYKTPVIVFEDEVIVWDVPGDVKQLSLEHAQDLKDFKGSADVFLLGTGDRLIFPDPAFKKAARENGVHLEIMDTGAACRTYNVLMAEGRRVAALLLLHSKN